LHTTALHTNPTDNPISFVSGGQALLSYLVQLEPFEVATF
jgi:hypothetical protein